MKKSILSVRILAEIAIFAAIGFALDYLQGALWSGVFFNGGSIGLAMVPIFIISYRRGLIPGILCGLILSFVQLLGGSIYVLAFWQFMLDYIFAYTVVGFAGAFAGLYKKSNNFGLKIVWIIVGCFVGGMLKYSSHVIAGIAYWLGNGEGTFLGVADNSALFSWVYNGAYCIPNIIISMVVMVIIAKFYPVFLNPEEKEAVKEETEEVVEQ
ncbi:MAG: energy-coupled thiamine transporter ThiT [Acholeplasmatales bacterium]|nr:energy-coupled thiamine transporter ThiT [Acholeplasmatales bacterium]